MKPLLTLGFALAVLSGCGRPKPLPVLGEVPDFTLTEQTGAPFHGSSLRGEVWVADFIFTHCTGPCPRMSSQMKMIQGAFAASEPVRLVSFTVDPARDTPEVLAAYGKHFEARAGRWYFLTGAQATLHHLSREVFKLGDVNGSLAHNTHFVLVDQQGRIRGYYGTSEGGAMKELVRDIRRLLRESA